MFLPKVPKVHELATFVYILACHNPLILLLPLSHSFYFRANHPPAPAVAIYPSYYTFCNLSLFLLVANHLIVRFKHLLQ